jgi:hypothetical protein
VPLRTGSQTAGMLVMDARLGVHGPLAKFIAQRRTPGPDWLKYEDIARELTLLTGIELTRPGVTKWAESLGIPDSGPKDDHDKTAAYLAAVDRYLRAPRGGRTA